jgi:hypothetical protein
MSNKSEKLKESDTSKHPARMGHSWNDDEIQRAKTSIQEGKSIVDIATEHQRTIGSISAIQRRMAVEYHIQHKTIEEIEKLTRLNRTQIEEIIIKNQIKTKKEKPNELKEILVLASEIQMKMSILMDKITKLNV